MATDTVVDVVMPQMGVSVSEGTISRWLKQEGEDVEKDETILEISTDKVDTEVPSPAAGKLVKILAQEGETLDVGAKLAEIDSGDGASAPSSGTQPAGAQAEPTSPPPATDVTEPATQKPTSAAPAASQPPAPPAAGLATSEAGRNGTPGGGKFVSPVVSRIAAEHGVDVSQVPGTGSGGRVTKKDIMSFIESGGQSAASGAATASTPAPAATTPAPASAPAPAAAAAEPASSAAPTPAPFTGGERVENFSPMRKAIARHMVESKQTSAHVTSTMEVDMTRVVEMRARLKGEVMSQWGTKLTFTHFVIRALSDAIAHWPMINSEVRGDSSVIKNYVHLGVAVALDGGAGLIVPVVRNIEEKNLVGIARAVNEIVDRARNKQLSPDDVAGGTFTLTNPGIFGAIHGTPIINQPQVAILDTEAIVKRPVVITDADGNDLIAIRSMMNLCISYDHRVIDGAYAVQFLAHLKRNLQEWDEQTFLG